jgi:hypothetical protein
MSKNKNAHLLKMEDSGIIEKLRALAQGLECGSISNDQNATTRKKRLAAVRDDIARIVEKELRPFCICQQITVANSCELADFEAKMGIPCPVHGPCRLGIIVRVGCYLNDGDPRDRRLHELVQEYRRRCGALRKRDEP